MMAMHAKILFTHADWRLSTQLSRTKAVPAPTLSSMPSRCRGSLAATPTVLWCFASLNLRATIGRSTSSFPADEPNALSGESDILVGRLCPAGGRVIDNFLYRLAAAWPKTNHRGAIGDSKFGRVCAALNFTVPRSPTIFAAHSLSRSWYAR